MGELMGVYIFGSVARGQEDHLSDLDLLAVVRDGLGKVEESEVTARIPSHLRHLKPGISWYGQKRIEEMFGNGELFAWHLHAETIPLFETFPFLKSLGIPAPYIESAEDVKSFQKVFREIPRQLDLNEYNAVYETGLMYVCMRNIAMAASSVLCPRPDFSRYSPFLLRGIRECPISKPEYELTMACRMAGQRGRAPPPGVDRALALHIFQRIDPWIDEVRLRLPGENLSGQQHKAHSLRSTGRNRARLPDSG